MTPLKESTVDNMKELIETAKELYKSQKKFNPIQDINLFSILGMENKEVAAHSAFLFFIFKPFYTANGERDDLNLKELYKQLIKGQNKYPLVENLDHIDIQREYSFSEGRLDFLITYFDKDQKKEDAIVIELKIWAGEQSGQIDRYRQFLDERGYSTDHIYFLTPTERNSETGISNNIVLGKTIKNTLDEIKILRKDSSAYITIIEQYITIIEKLKGENDMNENIENMINTREDIIAADMIFKQRTNALNEMMMQFLVKVKHELKILLSERYPKLFSSDKYALEFLDSMDNEDYVKSFYNKRCFPAIIVKLHKEWLKQEFVKLLDENGSDDYYPCFYIEIDNNLYAGFTIRCGETPEHYDLSKVKEKIKTEFNTSHFTNWFLDYEYVLIDNEKIEFRNYSDENAGVLRLFNNGSLVLGETAKQIAEYIINQIFSKQLEKFFDVAKINAK